MSDNPRLKSNNRRSKPKEHENYGQQGTKPNGTSTRPHQSYAHSPHQPTSTSTSSSPSLSSSASSATSPPTSSSPSLSSSTSSHHQPSPSLHPSSHKPSHPQPPYQSQPNDHSDPPQSSPHLHSSHSNSQANHSQSQPHPHSHSRSHSQSDSYTRSHPHPHSHSHSHSDSPGQPNGANGFHRRGSRHERTHSNPHAHTHAHAHAHSSPHQHHSHNQHPRNHQEPQQSQQQQQLQEDNKPTPPPESTELSPAQIETHLLHMWNITYDRARNPKIPEHERPLIYRDVAKAWGSESKNPVFAGDFNFSVELKKSFLAKFGTLAQRSGQFTSGDENGKNNNISTINTNDASSSNNNNNNNNNNVHSSSEENGKSVNNAVNREASYSNINNINNTNTNTNANETNTTNSTNNNINNNKNKNKKNKRDAQPTVDNKPNGKTTTKQQDHQNSEKQIPKEQITEPKESKQKLKQEPKQDSKQESKQDIKDTKHEAKETQQQEKHDAKQQKQDTKEPEPTPIKPEPQQQEIIPDAKQPEMAELETKVEEEEQEEEEEEETEEQVDEVYDYDFTNDEYEEISDPVDAQKGNPGDAIIDIPDMDDDAPQPTKQNGKSKAKPKKTKKGKSKPVKHHDSEKAVEPKNSNTTTTSNITFSNINNNNFTNNIINLTSNGNNEAWNDILGNLLPRPKAEITKASGTNTLQLDNAGNFTLAQDTAQANAALLNGIPREVVRVFANRFGKPNPTPNTDFPGILPVKWSSGEGLTSAGRKFPMEVPFLSLKDMFGSSNNKPTSKLSCANLRCQNTTTEDKPFKTCAKCNMTAYCSRDCQKEDWTKRHKQSCKSNAAEEQRKTFATQKFWATASIRHMIFLHWYGRYGKGVIILMCKDFLAYGEDDPSGRDLYIFYMPMADVMSEDCPIPALKKCQAEFAKSFVNHDTDSHSIASAAVDSTGFVTPQIDDVKVLQLKLHKRSCKDHDLQKVDAIAVDSHNQATLYTFH